jgi:transposase
MEVLCSRCCGIDVHKVCLVACLRIQDGRRVTPTIREFGTTTAELLRLQAWLSEAACTHVAMESTGIYWRPVFNVLEGTFQVVLANAYHIHAVPGRKTDVRDCEWIANLLAHGLIRASFIPPAEIRDLRDVTRHRKSVIRDRVKTANRIHKLLESANIKIGNVMSDVLGVSGRAMLDALLAGDTDPAHLSTLAKGSLRTKVAQLSDALRGSFTAHQACLLGLLLTQLDQASALIAACDARVLELAKPFEPIITRLQTIVGVGRRSAEVIVSEVGIDMTRFADAGHLASWARMCPGSHESAGKRRPAGTGKGNNWLRTTLLESAWAASHVRRSYLGAQYRRISRRRGPKRAAIAVAHSILVIAYHLLRDGVDFKDLGGDYFDRTDTAKLTRYHLRRLADLGCDVSMIARPA